jgi:hypothetical protein
MAGLAQTKERQIAELKRRLEESEANTQDHDSSDAQQPARKKSKSSNIEEENKIREIEDEVKRKGKQYCLLIAPWLSLPRASRLLAGVSSLDVDNDEFDHSTRYDSEENELHAEVLDLHTVLGPTVAAQISAENIRLVRSLVRVI